jgi:hypothetical protein
MFPLVESCCCHYKPGLNFTSTFCIICYHVTQTVVILNIRRLIFIYRNPYWRWLPSDYHYLILSTFISIPTSVTLSIMHCNTISSSATSTRWCTYYTGRIICLPLLKSPDALADRIRLGGVKALDTSVPEQKTLLSSRLSWFPRCEIRLFSVRLD